MSSRLATRQGERTCIVTSGPAAPIRSAAARPDVEEHVETAGEVREALAPLWKIICHDDPITTMDFVILVFVEVFRLPRPRAVERMYRVHYTGSAVVGLWPESAARRKVNRARGRARAEGFPLTFTLERDD